MRIEYGAATDVGAVRERNEDSYVARPGVYAVADGMGGHAAGDLASRIAAETVGELSGRDDVQPDDVVAAVHRANAAILQAGRDRPEAAGMGTTLTGIAVLAGGPDGPRAAVFNIGDSRVYLLADGHLEQVTVDHNEVAELVAAGRLSEEQAAVHPLRNVVTRSLGTERRAEPDVLVVALAPGQRFLACSDGLTLELDTAAIGNVLSSVESPEQAAARLVGDAVAAGGRDNVTAVVVDIRA